MDKKTKFLAAHVYNAPTWAKLRERSEVLKAMRPEDGFMATVLEGAIQAGEGNNPIRGNMCAAALRELVGHILHAMAPDEKVQKCCWYKQAPDTKGPTRRQRITFIVQGGLSVDYVANTLHLDHEEVAGPLVEAIDRLNKATHVREHTILIDDEKIRVLLDESLHGVLKLFDAARSCQNEVYRQLENEIDQAILEKFLSETIPELDELSTHTTFEGHGIDDIEVREIDEAVIKLAVSGTVHVELQYGSSSDLKRDEGAVMNDSYPYTARLDAKVDEPDEIVPGTVEVSVDNSGFYDNGDFDEEDA